MVGEHAADRPWRIRGRGPEQLRLEDAGWRMRGRCARDNLINDKLVDGGILH